MIKYKTEKIDKEVPVKAVCDRCGREATTTGDSCFEYLEFLSIRFRGGYGSVFGDGTDVECDICQHCLKDLIGDICRTKG